MSSFVSIRDLIYAKMQTLTTITSTNVKKYASENPEGFPCASVEMMGNESQSEDEVNNLRTYLYRVRIFVEMNREGIGQDGAEEVMGGILDEVVSAFDEDYVLGGAIDNLDVVTVTTGYSEIASGLARTAEITLRATKLESII